MFLECQRTFKSEIVLHILVLLHYQCQRQSRHLTNVPLSGPGACLEVSTSPGEKETHKKDGREERQRTRINPVTALNHGEMRPP